MAEAENKNVVVPKSAQGGFVFLPLIAGWLIPGARDIFSCVRIRGALLAISIVCMFALGLAMQGRLYANAHDILEMLGLAGDLGSGLLYIVGHVMGFGNHPVQPTVADRGTRFIVVAGLLNIIAAVDAHNIRTGRKL